MSIRILPLREQRCGKSAPRATVRIVASLVRRRIPGRSVALVTLHPGQAKICADLRTPLGLGLYRYGFCDLAAYVVRALARPGSVVVDGGANVGLVTLIAAETVGPSGRVIACEPSSKTMTVLQRNIQLNDLTWVEACEVALAEQPGELPFYEFDAGAGLSSFAPEDKDGASTRMVKVTTLDALVGGRLSDVSLVKLDLEGAEARALRGARQVLASARPDLLIEAEDGHLQRQGSSISELQSLVRDADYQGYSLGWEGRGLVARPLGPDWSDSPKSRDVLIRPRESRVEPVVLCEQRS